MNHLLPSNFLTGGFLVRMLSGFGFLPGAGLFPRLDWLSLRSGTLDPARREGFLCVIWSLDTFFKPLVTSSPLFNSEKTAPIEPLAGAELTSLMTGGGGGPGGGGGGGGGPPDVATGVEVAGTPAEASFLSASSTDTPLAFQGMPLPKVCFTYSVKAWKML